MRRKEPDDLRPEYRREDLGPGMRGKYLDRYRSGTNLALLSADVARASPTEESVSEGLCSLIEVEQRGGQISWRQGTRGEWSQQWRCGRGGAVRRGRSRRPGERSARAASVGRPDSAGEGAHGPAVAPHQP